MSTFVNLMGLTLVILTADVQAQRAITSESRAQSDALGEIIVTAQRREETVQKSSLAIQVVSAEQLKTAGVVAAKDLVAVVPGLQIGIEGPYTQIYIRGVGDFGASALSNPAVATSVDGVYFARPAAVGGQFYDLERVEVLKGPQGTLYGRNATGGARSTSSPTDQISTVLEATSTWRLVITGRSIPKALNLPLNDALALRAAFQVASHTGYSSDGNDDEQQDGGRIQALWHWSSAISLLLEADIMHFGGRGAGTVAIIPGIPPGTTRWLGTSDPRANAAALAWKLSTWHWRRKYCRTAVGSGPITTFALPLNHYRRKSPNGLPLLARGLPEWRVVEDKICSGFLPVDVLTQLFNAYRHEAASSGRRVTADDMGIRRQFVLWDSDKDAEALAKRAMPPALRRVNELLKRMCDNSGGKAASTINFTDVKANERKSAAVDARPAMEMSGEDEVIIGSPRTVADKIIDQCRRTGAGHCLIFPFSTLEETELEHSNGLLTEVVKHLSAAEIGLNTAA